MSRGNSRIPEYLDDLPKAARIVGDAEAGEIQIIRQDEEKERENPTGVLFTDEMHMFVNDAVLFPGGATRAQMRVIGTSMYDGPSGVVALAWRDGKIFLREIFRHGTRRWELEAQRGRRDEGFTSEKAALKELQEELGYPVKRITHIGDVSGDTALMASTLPVFWAELGDGPRRDHPESSEAFGRVIELTPAELSTRIERGEIRDGYTLAAITFACAAGKLRLERSGESPR
jgi:ADP-ribose pyrophosphatase